MKKISMLICAGVLMSALCAAFTACNNEPNDPGQKEESRGDEQNEQNEEPEETGVAPVKVSEEVAAFFEENAYLIGQAIIAQEYDDLGNFKFADKCVMINNVEELPAINGYDDAPLKYPAIDFDAYTLIIGQYVAIHGGIYLCGQAVVAEPEAAIMNIRLGAFDGPHDNAIRFKGFWGLYPKLPQESINVNVIVK